MASVLVSFVDGSQIQNRIQGLHLALTVELSKAGGVFWFVYFFNCQSIQHLNIGLGE